MKTHRYFQTRYNVGGYLSVFAVLFIFAMLGGAVLGNISSIGSDITIPVFTFAALLIIGGRYYFVQNAYKKRSSQIEELAKGNSWTFDKGPIATNEFTNLAIRKLSEESDEKSENFVNAKEWTYCDYSYGVYQHTKYGKTKIGNLYYAVMGTKLPRLMPNVLFDSHESRKQQFRYKFAGNQRLSLEGDFDNYFATYFPDNYKIDGLSFITPDVMEAMKLAQEYDIEIVGDELYIFGLMGDPTLQIPEMVKLIENIKKQLLDNILTYRDERLPFEVGRERVAIQGQTLRGSKWPLVKVLISAVIVIAYLTIMAFMHGR